MLMYCGDYWLGLGIVSGVYDVVVIEVMVVV